MDLLISYLLSESIFNFGKWPYWKCGNFADLANWHIFSLITSRSWKLFRKADLKWKGLYLSPKFHFLSVLNSKWNFPTPLNYWLLHTNVGMAHKSSVLDEHFTRYMGYKADRSRNPCGHKNSSPDPKMPARHERPKKLQPMAQTDGYGNSTTESAKWGWFSEKYLFLYILTKQITCLSQDKEYLFTRFRHRFRVWNTIGLAKINVWASSPNWYYQGQTVCSQTNGEYAPVMSETIIY